MLKVLRHVLGGASKFVIIVLEGILASLESSQTTPEGSWKNLDIPEWRATDNITPAVLLFIIF